MKTVLVTGASGQLGRCIEKQSAAYPDLDFLFMSSSEVDITDKCGLHQLFQAKSIDYCVNCAAYTNVEKAEEEIEKAFLVNAEAVKNLVEVCNDNDVVLFHISTDYVFDGTASSPYLETDATNPINVYGSSKLKGEEIIKNSSLNYFIFRTSWLYSEFGHNFFNTIMRKADEGADLKITTSQKGTPTNANDLAKLILKLIEEDNSEYGLYHFSNQGEATWYDFAEAILDFSGKKQQVSLEESNAFKTVAKRPGYSVLNKAKVEEKLNFKVPGWKESLEGLMASLVQN